MKGSHAGRDICEVDQELVGTPTKRCARENPPTRRVEFASSIKDKVVKRWTIIKHASGEADRSHARHTAVACTRRKQRETSRRRFNFTRLKDFDFKSSHEGTILGVSFHHASNVAACVTAGSRVHLLRIDGTSNNIIQSLSLTGRVKTVEFSRVNDQVIVCGKSGLFFGNVESGSVEKISLPTSCATDGTFVQTAGSDIVGVVSSNELCILSQKSRTCVASVKMSAPVRSCTFSPSGNEITCAAADGKIYCWDVRTQRCARVAGGFDSVVQICSSPDGKNVITGLDDGTVEIYNASDISWDVAKDGQKKARSISSFRTRITSLNVDPRADFVAMSSSLERNALRLLHLPSLSLVNTWPTSMTPLHYVSAHAFSHDGTILAIANARGRVLTYSASTPS
ncbi:WD40 repeat [Ostreococcus tauri]|uniref:WD40 repeat n=1 Tax=Ostreococcus tauri TaxID=70448 RepID=Q01F67_OSTTA|nr:WD40 repeat [Ostreococcus tauri]CAL52034.1 WD40 repeat [Ostreococcus tauri]|eukprot:XP_003074776.1 WD40 repeat [Ostreococcus tauri]